MRLKYWQTKKTQTARSVTDPLPLLWVSHHCYTLWKLFRVWWYAPAQSKVVFSHCPLVWGVSTFLGLVCYLHWGDMAYSWFFKVLNFSYLNQNIRICLYKLQYFYMGPTPLAHVTWAIPRIDQKEDASELWVSRSKWSLISLRGPIYKISFWPPKYSVTLPFTVFSLVKASLFLV